MWAWIAIGVGAFVVLSALVALVVARTLAVIAREASALYETEGWAVMPLSREASAERVSEPEEGAAAEESGGQRGRSQTTQHGIQPRRFSRV